MDTIKPNTIIKNMHLIKTLSFNVDETTSILEVMELEKISMSISFFPLSSNLLQAPPLASTN